MTAHVLVAVLDAAGAASAPWAAAGSLAGRRWGAACAALDVALYAASAVLHAVAGQWLLAGVLAFYAAVWLVTVGMWLRVRRSGA